MSDEDGVSEATGVELKLTGMLLCLDKSGFVLTGGEDGLRVVFG